MLVYVGLGGLGGLLLIVLLTRVNITYTYQLSQSLEFFKIEHSIWGGLIRHRKVLLKRRPADAMKLDGDDGGSGNLLNKVSKLIEILKSFKPLLKKFLSKSEISYLKINMIVGTGDAASAAVLNGVLWAGVGNALHLLSKYTKIKTPPAITIKPYFNGKIANVEMTCIVRFRIGKTVIAWYKIKRFWHKYDKQLKAGNQQEVYKA